MLKCMYERFTSHKKQCLKNHQFRLKYSWFTIAKISEEGSLWLLSSLYMLGTGFCLKITEELFEALQIIHVVITTRHSGYPEGLENETQRYKQVEEN